MQTIKSCGFALIMAGLMPGFGMASEYAGPYFYRYINDNGETVIATQVPRGAARRGYEVLTDTGRILEAVDPELSEEARSALSLQQKIERQKQAQAERQAQEDKELLRLFASTDDVDRSLERLLEEIDARIEVITSNIKRQRLQFQQKQTKAAELERTGRKVPDNLVQDMNNLQAAQERLAQDITGFEKEKDKLRIEYARRKDRVRHLVEGEDAFTRNGNLVLSSGDITGTWEPLRKGAGVISWMAESGGRFVLIRSKGLEKWRGNWSLNRNNEIVVVYFRKEVTRAGKTSKTAFALEERYPIMDFRGGDLYVFWDDSVIKFRKAGT